MESVINNKSIAEKVISGFFGFIFVAIGIINTFWGNDMFFGIFIILLATVYFFPVTSVIGEITGFTLPHTLIKIILGAFIIWAAIGVGELGDKIDMMLLDLKGPSE